MKIKRESIENPLVDSLALCACVTTRWKAWKIEAIKTRASLSFGPLKSPEVGFAAIFEVPTSSFMATFHAGTQPKPFRWLLKKVVLKCLPPDETGQAVGHHLPLAWGDHCAQHLTSETSLVNSWPRSMRFHGKKRHLRENSILKSKRHAEFYWICSKRFYIQSPRNCLPAGNNIFY